MHRTRALLVASLFVAAFAHADTHRSFNVAPGGTLTLDTHAGTVRVNSGGSGVSVDVDHQPSELDVKFVQNGNDVTVTGRMPEMHRWFNFTRDNWPEYVINVPSTYNVHVSTSGGSVRIGDLTGEVRVHTSGGDLEVGRVNGAVDARTSGGGIRVDAATSLQARTSGGSIDVHSVGGNVYAHTSGGGITIDNAEGTIDAETSGGSIRARFSRPLRADSRLSTSGGGISVSLASNVAVDVDARSSGGGVDSDVPVTILGRQDEDALSGKINGGGPHLTLRSSGGGIHIKRM